jgi:hypothetical protein
MRIRWQAGVDSPKVPNKFPTLLQVIIRESSVARPPVLPAVPAVKTSLPILDSLLRQATRSTHPVGTPSFFHPSLPPVTSLLLLSFPIEPSTASDRSVEEKQQQHQPQLPPPIPHATPKLLQAIDTCPFHRMHRIINAWATLTLTGHIAGLLFMIG